MNAPHFDLTREPWLPCRLLDGTSTEMGIRDAFARAHEIRELFDPCPLVTVALHRLLLAILHRVHGPKDEQTWSRLWSTGRFDTAALNAYLDRWETRFTLFDPKNPFYQVPADEDATEDAKSIAFLLYQADNAATLFHHARTEAPPRVPPQAAARALVAFQAFDTGGMKSGHGAEKFCAAAPLSNRAVVTIQGSTLFETLLLNLHRYDRDDEAPFQFGADDDAPAWERAPDSGPVVRTPQGWVDLLTWQTRRIHLFPEGEPDGRWSVPRVSVRKGAQYPKGYEEAGKDVMVAYLRQDQAIAPQPLRLREDRLLWRDSDALMQASESRQVPPILDWLETLVTSDRLPRAKTFDVSVVGYGVDRGSVAILRFWRHERLPLDTRYLCDKALRDMLLLGIRWAETGAETLNDACWHLVRDVLYPSREIDDPLSRNQKDAIRNCLDGFAPGRAYWPELEAGFAAWIADLPRDLSRHGTYGDSTAPRWIAQIQDAATSAFRAATRAIASERRSIRALAKAEAKLWRELRRNLPPSGTRVIDGATAAK